MRTHSTQKMNRCEFLLGCLLISAGLLFTFREMIGDQKPEREVFRGITIHSDSVEVEFSEENEALMMHFLSQEALQTFEKVAEPRK